MRREMWLAAILASICLSGGCEKKAYAPSQQSADGGLANDGKAAFGSPRTAPGYETEVLEQAIRNFAGLQSQCSASPRFCNSINVTLSQLQDYRDALKKWGILIPHEMLSEAEFPCAPGMEYVTYSSEDYSKQLGSSLAGYGYLQSGRLPSAKPGIPLAKAFLSVSFPNDVFLIEGGEWRGFFTKTNGDLVIPGKRFYDEVFTGRRPVASMRTTTQYFKSQTLGADDLLSNGDYAGAIRMLTEFLANPMAPPEAIAAAYYNLGYAKDRQHDDSGAIRAYTSSIRIKPLVAAYTNRALAYSLYCRKAMAVADLRAAMKLVKDPQQEQKLSLLLQETCLAKCIFGDPPRIDGPEEDTPQVANVSKACPPPATEDATHPNANRQVVLGTDRSSLWIWKGAAFNEYLRFYSDGTVTGASSPDPPLDMLFKAANDKGTYSISGSSIKFSLTSPAGTVDYDGVIQGSSLQLNGVIQGSSLQLNWFSRMNNTRGKRRYEVDIP